MKKKKLRNQQINLKINPQKNPKKNPQRNQNLKLRPAAVAALSCAETSILETRIAAAALSKSVYSSWPSLFYSWESSSSSIFGSLFITSTFL